MKRHLVFSLTVIAASSLLAADSTPKDDITSAAKKLGDQPNYSWRTTIVVPEDAPFKPGPTDGKTEKDGVTWVSMSMFDNKMQAVLKGDKGAATQEGAWKSLDEIEKQQGFARMPAAIVRNLKLPAKEAAELASFAKELKKEGDVYASDLTEQGAKTLQTWRPLAGSEGPTVSDATGSVKFWLKNGALTKYEFKLKGNISFNGNEFPNDRTTTVEIKDVGTTKLEVPEEALKKSS
jgi:hypothetical protein